MIQAKVIADSKNEFGHRITTMVVTFPRIILAEFNTHRMFSRNSASSRAIPFEKMVKSVQDNPFIPIAWQKDHKGMQGTEYFINNDKTIGGQSIPYYNECTWLEARDKAVATAKDLSEMGVTKQLCNRLLEPFMWHTVIVTATEWENFFALRCPQYRSDISGKKWRSKKDVMIDLPITKNNDEQWWRDCNKGQAEIHMMALAETMWDALNESTPKELKAGEWHIPFGDNLVTNGSDDLHKLYGNHPNEDNIAIKIATARCARVSYTVVGEEARERNIHNAYEQDIKLHDRLAASGHWSPFEHCAKAMSRSTNDERPNNSLKIATDWWSGNFKGFIQYRKTFNNENIT